MSRSGGIFLKRKKKKVLDFGMNGEDILLSTSGTTGFENNSFTFQIQNHTPPALPEKEGSDGD